MHVFRQCRIFSCSSFCVSPATLAASNVSATSLQRLSVGVQRSSAGVSSGAGKTGAGGAPVFAALAGKTGVGGTPVLTALALGCCGLSSEPKRSSHNSSSAVFACPDKGDATNNVAPKQVKAAFPHTFFEIPGGLVRDSPL